MVSVPRLRTPLERGVTGIIPALGRRFASDVAWRLVVPQGHKLRMPHYRRQSFRSDHRRRQVPNPVPIQRPLSCKEFESLGHEVRVELEHPAWPASG
jgi:hypothetical protein